MFPCDCGDFFLINFDRLALDRGDCALIHGRLGHLDALLVAHELLQSHSVLWSNLVLVGVASSRCIPDRWPSEMEV